MGQRTTKVAIQLVVVSYVHPKASKLLMLSCSVTFIIPSLYLLPTSFPSFLLFSLLLLPLYYYSLTHSLTHYCTTYYSTLVLYLITHYSLLITHSSVFFSTPHLSITYGTFLQKHPLPSAICCCRTFSILFPTIPLLIILRIHHYTANNICLIYPYICIHFYRHFNSM